MKFKNMDISGIVNCQCCHIFVRSRKYAGNLLREQRGCSDGNKPLSLYWGFYLVYILYMYLVDSL